MDRDNKRGRHHVPRASSRPHFAATSANGTSSSTSELVYTVQVKLANGTKYTETIPHHLWKYVNILQKDDDEEEEFTNYTLDVVGVPREVMKCFIECVQILFDYQVHGKGAPRHARTTPEHRDLTLASDVKMKMPLFWSPTPDLNPPYHLVYAHIQKMLQLPASAHEKVGREQLQLGRAVRFMDTCSLFGVPSLVEIGMAIWMTTFINVVDTSASPAEFRSRTGLPAFLSPEQERKREENIRMYPWVERIDSAVD